MIVVRVNGRPITKGSDEGSRRKRASYDHGAAGEWRERLQLAFRRFAPRQPFRFGVRLDAVFFLHDPVARIDGHVEPALEPPDRDKLLRFIQDEAEGHFYTSDAQVITGPTTKQYAVAGDPDQAEGVVLRFEDLGHAVPPLPEWARGVPDAVPELTAARAAGKRGAA